MRTVLALAAVILATSPCAAQFTPPVCAKLAQSVSAASDGIEGILASLGSQQLVTATRAASPDIRDAAVKLDATRKALIPAMIAYNAALGDFRRQLAACARR